jgi:hypothetical protein
MTNAKADTHTHGGATVERLKGAPWNLRLTTARLMALTRDLHLTTPE